MFYHGKNGWQLGVEFSDWFKCSEYQQQLYLKYLPNFTFNLFDLTKQRIERLNLSLYFRKLLEIMRSIDQNTFINNLAKIFRLSKTYFSTEKGLVKLRKLLQYASIKGNVTFEQITQATAQNPPKSKEETMATILEMMEQEYLQREQKGAQELLIKQLERRFGPFTENERDIVFNCKNREQLESASIALIESRTKEEVLAELV